MTMNVQAHEIAKIAKISIDRVNNIIHEPMHMKKALSVMRVEFTKGQSEAHSIDRFSGVVGHA